MKNNNNRKRSQSTPPPKEPEPIPFTVPDLQNFDKDAADECIEDCQLDPDLVEAIYKGAAAAGVSFDEFIMLAAQEKLAAKKPKASPRRKKSPQMFQLCRKHSSGQMEVCLVLVPQEVKALQWFIRSRQVSNKEGDLSDAARAVLHLALSNPKVLVEMADKMVRYCRAEDIPDQYAFMLGRMPE